MKGICPDCGEKRWLYASFGGRCSACHELNNKLQGKAARPNKGDGDRGYTRRRLPNNGDYDPFSD